MTVCFLFVKAALKKIQVKKFLVTKVHTVYNQHNNEHKLGEKKPQEYIQICSSLHRHVVILIYAVQQSQTETSQRLFKPSQTEWSQI